MKRQPASENTAYHVARITVVDALIALIASVFALLLYLRTLAPGVLGGDSGEFQFAAWLGGFAHPTGYPLYLLLGWLWTHLLPLHDPAWRMNAFSALLGAVATGLVYVLALRMLRQVTFNPWPRLLAIFAALTFTVTPTFWSQATLAEVYTLNVALVAAILLGMVTWGQTGSRRALYLTALLYGLSLAHHRTTLLYLPAIAVYLWLVARAAPSATRNVNPEAEHPELVEGCEAAAAPDGALRQTQAANVPRSVGRQRLTLSLRHFVILALLVLAPLMLYLIIPLAAPHAPYFEIRVGPDRVLPLYRPTAAGFIEHISGQGFGSALGVGGSAAARLKGLPALFAAELTVVGTVLGMLGLIGLGLRVRPLLALTGLSFLAIVGFNLVYGIGDIYGYYIPAYLIWVLWVALGLGAVCDAVWGRSRRIPLGHGDTEKRRHGEAESIPAQPSPRRRVPASPRHWLALALCVISLALPIYLLATNFISHDRSHDATAQAWNALLAQPIAQDAILITNDRDEMMPQWYLKYVEGRRADLTGLFPLIQPGPEWADVGAVTEQALRSGRPVYWIKPMLGMEVRFASEAAPDPLAAPGASLVRVLGPAAPNPPERPAEAVFGDAIRLAGYDLSPATLNPGGTAELTLHWQPLTRLDADFTTFVHLVDADGNKLSQSDHRPGGVFYPTSLWKPGETLADRHTLTVPTTLGRCRTRSSSACTTARPGFSSWVSRSRSAHCPDNVFALRASFVMWYTRDQ